MELQLEELEATATEDELAAERAAAQTQSVKSFQRRRPSRQPFPDHLLRERVVIAAPERCPCCEQAVEAWTRKSPRRWRWSRGDPDRAREVLVPRVRDDYPAAGTVPCDAARLCGPNLLAMILFEKFGQHQPLNRQSERYRREGIDLSLSTLADQVGACTSVLQPLHALIERHVLAAERLHGDDTNVPILAKGQTIKGHIWTYVRDDRPFGGRAPAAALYYITPRAIADTSIPPGILAASPTSSRRTPIAAITSCTTPHAGRDRSRLRCVRPTPGGSSSSWRISRPMPGAARTRRRSRRSRSKRSSALTRCLTSNAASTARAPKNGCACVGSRARRCWRPWKYGCASNAPASRTRPRSPSRLTTCCAAGSGLPASSTMGGSA